MSVVGRELPTSLSHLICPHNSQEISPALREDKEVVHKAKREDSTG